MRSVVFFIPFLLFNFQTNLFAADLVGDNKNWKIEVRSLDESTNLEALNNDHYKKINGLSDIKKSHPNRLPATTIRDGYFLKSGLATDIKAMDDLDRDILWRKTERLSQPELEKNYPSINPIHLKSLKNLLNEISE